MSPIHLGNPASVQLDGVDLTPHVEAMELHRDPGPGPWERHIQLGSEGCLIWSASGDFSPALYRWVTGRKHPRVTALRRAYRARRRRW